MEWLLQCHDRVCVGGWWNNPWFPLVCMFWQHSPMCGRDKTQRSHCGCCWKCMTVCVCVCVSVCVPSLPFACHVKLCDIFSRSPAVAAHKTRRCERWGFFGGGGAVWWRRWGGGGGWVVFGGPSLVKRTSGPPPQQARQQGHTIKQCWGGGGDQAGDTNVKHRTLH